VAVIDQAQSLGAQAAGSVPGRVIRKFLDDGGPQHAVLIAWNALFSLFPIILALAAIGGAVLSLVGVGDAQIETFILRILPQGGGGGPAIGPQMASAVRGVRQHSGLLGVISLVGFLWSASSLFGALEQSLGKIVDAPPRGFVRSKVMSVLMMLLFAVLAIVGVASSSIVSVLTSLPIPQPPFIQGGTVKLIQGATGVLAGFLLFFSIYYVVPGRRRPVGVVWPGAAFAAIGFELLTLLFPLYLHFNSGANQYGSTFALLFVTLTFMYFLGLIIVLGAEIDAVLEPVAAKPSAAAPARGEPSGHTHRLRWAYGLAGGALGLGLALRFRRRSP
jgi:membrane protein